MEIEVALLYVIGAPVVVATISLTALIVGRALKAMGLDSLTGTKAYTEISKQP